MDHHLGQTNAQLGDNDPCEIDLHQQRFDQRAPSGAPSQAAAPYGP